jgi:hypothetical protein
MKSPSRPSGGRSLEPDLPDLDSSPASPGKKADTGFFGKILGFFMSLGDANSEKKRQLRAISKELNRSRFRFYKPKGFETQPNLARFFFEIYKCVAPAQTMLQNALNSGVLRSFVIESFLTREQRELSERLLEASIVERSKTMDVRKLQEAVRADMTQFLAIFDGVKSRQIDIAYNTLLSFVNFVNFDYFFLLKKFDSGMNERVFSYKPKFDAISGDYVADDLKDFMEVFLPLALDADWTRIFAALKEYRKIDIVQQDAWAKLVPALLEVRSSQVLDLIVKHLQRDPYYQHHVKVTDERIVEPFLEKLKTQLETVVQRIAQERRTSAIDETVRKIFGTSVIVRMKNYTDKANPGFEKKNLPGYTYTQPINYLKAFLIDFYKKDIRDLIDLVIIRGKWTTNIQSQQLSETYHALIDVSDAILTFDDSLADDGEAGTRLRLAMTKAERDREQVKYARNLLHDINQNALAIMNKAANNFILLGRQVKALIEDFDKSHREILLNWKEVESASPAPLREIMVGTYKKIYYIVQLMQFFAKEE